MRPKSETLTAQELEIMKVIWPLGRATVRAVYDAPALCGVLAHSAQLRPTAEPVTPRALLADFSWARVRPRDRVAHWTGRELTLAN